MNISLKIIGMMLIFFAFTNLNAMKRKRKDSQGLIVQTSALVQLPAEIKMLIIDQLIINILPRTIANIQNIAAINKHFHALINHPSNMQWLLKTMTARIDEVDEGNIARGLSHMPGIAHEETQIWLAQRAQELKREEEFFDAIEKNNQERFDILLKEKINVNARHKTKKITPLICASSLNRTQMVQQLIDAGADVNLYGLDKSSPLLNAIGRGNQEVVQKLIYAKADLNHRDINGFDALHLAIFLGSYVGFEDLAILLIDAKADINRKIFLYKKEKDTQVTPLIFAILTGKMRVFNKLLESNVDVNLARFNGQTPLMLAIYKKNLDMLRKLLHAGAHINMQDANGHTPLIYTILGDQWTMMSELIARKVYLDLQNNQGWTALMVASGLGRAQMVNVLLDAGARLDLKSEEGKTALDYAKESKADSVVQQTIIGMLEKDATNIYA